MPHKAGIAEVNGTHLQFEIAGSGHPLVLIHGFSLDGRMWDDQFFTFANNYRVLRYDMRGFGKSALPTTEEYSHVDDLVALLDHVGLPKAHLVGLSLGGRVAIDTAIAHPTRVASLVPVDTVLQGYKWTSDDAGYIWKAAAELGVATAKQLWLEHPYFTPARRNPDVAYRLGNIIREYSGWHFVNQDPWRPLNPSALDQLHTITSPTKVLVGEKDLEDFHLITSVIKSKVQGSTSEVIADAGHMCNMEQPELFNKAVLSFLPR